jgi:hypothetical protein
MCIKAGTIKACGFKIVLEPGEVVEEITFVRAEGKSSVALHGKHLQQMVKKNPTTPVIALVVNSQTEQQRYATLRE